MRHPDLPLDLPPGEEPSRDPDPFLEALEDPIPPTFDAYGSEYPKLVAAWKRLARVGPPVTRTAPAGSLVSRASRKIAPA